MSAHRLNLIEDRLADHEERLLVIEKAEIERHEERVQEKAKQDALSYVAKEMERAKREREKSRDLVFKWAKRILWILGGVAMGWKTIWEWLKHALNSR